MQSNAGRASMATVGSVEAQIVGEILLDDKSMTFQKSLHRQNVQVLH